MNEQKTRDAIMQRVRQPRLAPMRVEAHKPRKTKINHKNRNHDKPHTAKHTLKGK